MWIRKLRPIDRKKKSFFFLLFFLRLPFATKVRVMIVGLFIYIYIYMHSVIAIGFMYRRAAIAGKTNLQDF